MKRLFGTKKDKSTFPVALVVTKILINPELNLVQIFDQMGNCYVLYTDFTVVPFIISENTRILKDDNNIFFLEDD